ncbi:hypothetical protein MCHI_000727 [Candidatus Magnetoovum chiemensis]|nr:hypothetical protein MCHI_000727 [Candidatus Magnetoovum chiemensis]
MELNTVGSVYHVLSYVTGETQRNKMSETAENKDVKDKNQENEKIKETSSSSESSETSADEKSKDVEQQQAVQRLKAREREVITHEQAHRSVGGQYAGSAHYEYTRGPDGRSYISGGEVSLDMSSEKNPEDTIRKMRQLRAAALAPAQPSPQDHAVAAKASQLETKAKAELLQEKIKEALQENNNKQEQEEKSNIIITHSHTGTNNALSKFISVYL